MERINVVDEKFLRRAIELARQARELSGGVAQALQHEHYQLRDVREILK